MDTSASGLYSSIEITPSATLVDNKWFPALQFVFVSEFEEPPITLIYGGTQETLKELAALLKKAANAAALYCQQVQDQL